MWNVGGRTFVSWPFVWILSLMVLLLENAKHCTKVVITTVNAKYLKR